MNVAVSAADLAECFDLSERRIRQLVEAGMPKEAHGTYNLPRCVQWFVAHRVKEALVSVEVSPINDARRRHVNAMATIRELELAQLQGHLLAEDFVAEQWDDALAALRAAVDLLPFRVSDLLVAAKCVKPALRRRTRRVCENYLEAELLPELQKAADFAEKDPADGGTASDNGRHST